MSKLTVEIPVWWPPVAASAGRRRHVTGLLLAHATPHLDGVELTLTFTNPDIEQAWRDSGAQAALEGALEQHGIQTSVAITAA